MLLVARRGATDGGARSGWGRVDLGDGDAQLGGPVGAASIIAT